MNDREFNQYVEAIQGIHRSEIEMIKTGCEERMRVVIERRDPLSLEEAAQVLFNNNDRDAYTIESITVNGSTILKITKIDD
jgi:hypothetical protein